MFFCTSDHSGILRILRSCMFQDTSMLHQLSYKGFSVCLNSLYEEGEGGKYCFLTCGKTVQLCG